MSKDTIVSLHIEKPSSPVSSFSAKKPLAGLFFTFASGNEEEFFIAADTSKLISKDRERFIGLDSIEGRDLLSNYDLKACWSRLLNMVKRREYSAHDIHMKLQSKGFQSKSIDAAIERALIYKFIDDKRFGEVYIRSKIGSGWGRGRIEKELKLKGIDLDLLSGDILELLSEENEFKRAYELLKHKKIFSNNIEQKYIRFLVSRGFSYPISYRVTKSYIADLAIEDENS